MSSAIGNYVHYHWSNYLKSGTERTRNSGYNTFDSWRSQRNDIINRAERLANSGLRQNETDLKSLENVLNALMVPTDSASERVAQIHKQVDQFMQEDFGDALQKIDHDTGNITFANPEKDYIGQANKIDIEDIVNRINRLENELIRQASQGGTIPKDVFNTVKTLKQMYKEAYDNLKKIQQNKRWSVTTISNKIFDEDLELGRQVLNDLIQEYAAFPAMGLQKGKLFEHLISFAPAMMDQSADAAIGEVVGQLTGNVSYNMGAFDQYYTSHQNINGILTTTHASQGKIDVTID